MEVTFDIAVRQNMKVDGHDSFKEYFALSKWLNLIMCARRQGRCKKVRKLNRGVSQWGIEN